MARRTVSIKKATVVNDETKIVSAEIKNEDAGVSGETEQAAVLEENVACVGETDVAIPEKVTTMITTHGQKSSKVTQQASKVSVEKVLMPIFKIIKD